MTHHKYFYIDEFYINIKVSLHFYKKDHNLFVDLTDKVITPRMMLDLVIEHFSIDSPVNKVDLSQIGIEIENRLEIFKAGGYDFVINAEEGKFADNKSGWTQINAGTTISFVLEHDSTVELEVYESLENFTIDISERFVFSTSIVRLHLPEIM